MKGRISMSQRVINVKLSALDEDTDILSFHISEDDLPQINLNNATCQNDLKNVFTKLLQLAVEDDISLEFSIEDGYARGLYKDVCSEYIMDINRELREAMEAIRRELSSQA